MSKPENLKQYIARVKHAVEERHKAEQLFPDGLAFHVYDEFGTRLPKARIDYNYQIPEDGAPVESPPVLRVLCPLTETEILPFVDWLCEVYRIRVWGNE